MSELSPTAKELVESHRRSKVLARADRERMKDKLMLRVATLGAGTAATGTALGMSLASKIALVALGVTVVGGAGTYSLWALRGRAPADVVTATQASLPPAPEMVAPAPVPTPEGAAVPAEEVPIDRGGSEHTKKVGRRPTVTAAATPGQAVAVVSDPEPELRVLREAREDLRAGRPESAFRRLEEYGRQHSVGMLTQERKALAAIALCHWQPGPEAQARASEFLRNSPDSPLAKRVRAACEKGNASP